MVLDSGQKESLSKIGLQLLISLDEIAKQAQRTSRSTWNACVGISMGSPGHALAVCFPGTGGGTRRAHAAVGKGLAFPVL
jgi:hypothetical protein